MPQTGTIDSLQQLDIRGRDGEAYMYVYPAEQELEGRGGQTGERGTGEGGTGERGDGGEGDGRGREGGTGERGDGGEGRRGRGETGERGDGGEGRGWGRGRGDGWLTCQKASMVCDRGPWVAM